MINNPTIKIKLAPSRNAEVNILYGVKRIIMGVLALIAIAWMNNGFFTYAMPYISNIIRYGLYFAWFGLALVGNKTFVKTYIIQAWPLLLFCFYLIFISLFVKTDLARSQTNISNKKIGGTKECYI